MVERKPPSDNIRRKSRELLTIEQRRGRFESGARLWRCLLRLPRRRASSGRAILSGCASLGTAADGPTAVIQGAKLIGAKRTLRGLNGQIPLPG
jgi:hypothetical protein